MKIKFGLRIKFTLLFIGLILLMVSAVLYQRFNGLKAERQLNYAISVARVVEGMVNEEGLRHYMETGEEDKGYGSLISEMTELLQNANVYYLYVVTVETEESGKYIFDLKKEGTEAVWNHRLGENSNLKANYPGLSEVLASKEASTGFDRMVSNGEKLDSVYVPVLDEREEVIAFVGVDFKEEGMAKETMEMIRRAKNDGSGGIIFGACALLCLLLLFFMVWFSVLRPVYRLQEHAEQIERGNFHYETPVRGHDELSEITEVFNRMSRHIAENIGEMQILSDAYYKYVPSKILTLLKKKSIVEVKPGDAESAMLTVFSLQMAEFATTIRKKSTTEMVDSINRVLRVSVPAVADRGGMIEGFQHAGFTALFEQKGEAALSGAVAICQTLNRMARQKQIEKNQAGIGIAYGEVTLGIVGQEMRMAAVMFSQYKDAACWLQQIACRYQAHILITRTAADNIPGFYDTYHVRNLGFLHNSYTGYTDRIYDVYDGDAEEEKELKNATKADFEKGVELYCMKDFPEARRKFIAVLKRFRRDRAAKEYLNLCDRYCRQENQQDIEIYFTKME
ncbi:MAG: HAMP domain-containing protein [Bacteroidales bacterium]|nr:HAMP domain-containing protein [Clostridium sp.]MCM1203320.1 HAMP domain-containing protein [Bacteroidales bacterium]